MPDTYEVLMKKLLYAARQFRLGIGVIEKGGNIVPMDAQMGATKGWAESCVRVLEDLIALPGGDS